MMSSTLPLAPPTSSSRTRPPAPPRCAPFALSQCCYITCLTYVSPRMWAALVARRIMPDQVLPSAFTRAQHPLTDLPAWRCTPPGNTCNFHNALTSCCASTVFRHRYQSRSLHTWPVRTCPHACCTARAVPQAFCSELPLASLRWSQVLRQSTTSSCT